MYLDQIIPFLAKAVDGHNLTTLESEKLVHHIFVYDTVGLHFAAWVGAMHAKSETSDELLGFLRATAKLGVKFTASDFDINRTTDLSGTGGGKFKSFNVSTTSSFLIAAAGYTVPKEAYFALTGPTGSADMFTAFGIDVLNLTGKQCEKTLKKVGICPIIAPSISPELANRNLISRKFWFERRIRVHSPMHLASNIFSPLPMKYRIYGCYSERYLEILGNLFKKLGFQKTLTFCADIGLPEISNVGKTTIVEQNGNKIRKYILTPSDLGIRSAKPMEIATGGRDQNILNFLRILTGKEHGPKADLAAINAAAALYVLGESKSIAASVPKAQEIIKTGAGFEVLQKLVREIGQLKLLHTWLKKT